MYVYINLYTVVGCVLKGTGAQTTHAAAPDYCRANLEFTSLFRL